MNVAAAIPKEHVAVRYCIEIAAEVLVGGKDYLFVLGEALHYGARVG